MQEKEEGGEHTYIYIYIYICMVSYKKSRTNEKLENLRTLSYVTNF
jgi:hypothetical protein